jgi:flagellar hook-basal body complex protein FliE
MPIDPISMAGGGDPLAVYRQLTGVASPTAADGATSASPLGGASGTQGFGSMLASKLQGVVELQNQGAAAAQALATGQATDVSAATVSVEKASIALQLVGAMRNKAIDAYQDIMRMQV